MSSTGIGAAVDGGAQAPPAPGRNAAVAQPGTGPADGAEPAGGGRGAVDQRGPESQDVPEQERADDAPAPEPPRPRPVRYSFTRLMAGLDAVAALTALLVMRAPVLFVLLAVPAVLVANNAGGLYRPRLRLSAFDDVPPLIGWGLTAFAGTAAGLALLGAEPGAVGGLARLVVLHAALVVALRWAGYHALRHWRRSRPTRHTTLVLGAGPIGDRLAATLLEHPDYGLHPVGMLDANRMAGTDEVLPMLGTPADLARVIRDRGVRAVVIAFGAFRDSEIIEAMRVSSRLDCEIFVVPRFFELGLARGWQGEELAGIPVLRLAKVSPRSLTWLGKRSLDVLASATGLVLLSPLLAVLAIGVRWETGPGVLFRQDRVGMDGRHFALLKFRSLKPATAQESATNWNIAHDDRLGRFGRMLRRTSLDELPQLWNVLRGDMSLVGPRPERPYFVAQFESDFDGYTTRHRMPVGITGLAQVNGYRGDTSIQERVRFDNRYIDRWSLWQDIRILVQTIVSLRHPGGG